jgi:hypothetical protein
MKKARARGKKAPAPAGVTGTYRYDKERGEIVLVSAGVPKVASKGRSSAREMGPCGRDRRACGGGSCG